MTEKYESKLVISPDPDDTGVKRQDTAEAEAITEDPSLNRTVLLTPTDSGVIRNEQRTITPPERPPSDELDCEALLSANEQTYRRTNVRDAIDYLMKKDPDSIPYFEGAIADYASDKLDAAEG